MNMKIINNVNITNQYSNFYNKAPRLTNNNEAINFGAKPKPYNVFNPCAHYLMDYMNVSAKNSQVKFDPIIPELEGKIKTVKLKSSGGKEISGWDINPNNSDKYVLFLHGMAQNVTNYQPMYKSITDKGVGVFALEYRGYGANKSAKCSEYKLSKDVEKAYEYITKEKGISPKNVTVLGHSMGGALTVDFAKTHRDIKSVVLVAPITHTDKLTEKFVEHARLGLGMPKKLYELSQTFKPLKWLTGKNYNSLENIKGVETPVHLIQSLNDSVTSAEGAKVLEQIADKKGILASSNYVNGGGHKVDSQKVDIIGNIIENIYTK